MKKDPREQHYRGGDDSNTQLHNSIDNYLMHLFSTRFQRPLGTFWFIRLFDLIKVPQVGSDSYYYHFIDKETEAQKGADSLKALRQGSREVRLGLFGFSKFL